MTLEQALQKDIEDCQRWLNLEKDEILTREILPKRIKFMPEWIVR